MSSDVSHRVQHMWFQKRVDVHQGCGYSAAVQRARLFVLLLSTKTECDANDRECVVNRRLLFQSLCTATVSSRSGSKGGENGFWRGTARHRSRFVRIQHVNSAFSPDNFVCAIATRQLCCTRAVHTNRLLDIKWGVRNVSQPLAWPHALQSISLCDFYRAMLCNRYDASRGPSAIAELLAIDSSWTPN